MRLLSTLLLCFVFTLPSVSKVQTPPLTEEEYNTLFPYRFGTEATADGGYIFNPENDFYTYQSFLEAIERMKNIKVSLERREGTNLYRVSREDKVTGEVKVIRTDAGFDDSWNSQKSIIQKEVDYANFLAEGTADQRKRELSAFLANISQETTGGWATAPGGKYAWGLYFREEVSYAGTDLIGYVEQNHPDYPAVAGKSYHGRGPIQLSWNYNYGQVSQFLYGDKNVLLANPERVIEDGALAFQTAIWFWMTPQFPKPSAHDVMVGNWEPTSFDLENNRIPGFGVTVNIINGGLECGSGTEKSKVLSRIGHFERHSGILNVSTDLDGQSSCNACGCATQKPFGGNEPEPTPKKPRISLVVPTSNEIRMESFSSFEIEVSVLDKEDNAIGDVTIAINGDIVSSIGTKISYTPSQYGTITITIVANDQFGESSTLNYDVDIINPAINCGTAWEGKVYISGEEVVFEGIVYTAGWETKATDIPGVSNVWKIKETCPGYLFDCNGIEEWSATKTYQTNGSRIIFNNQIYTFLKWWSVGNQPDLDPTTWQLLGNCAGTGNVPPTIVFNQPLNNAVIYGLEPLQVALDNSANLVWSIRVDGVEVSTTAQFNYTPLQFGTVIFEVTGTDANGLSSTKSLQVTFQEEVTNIPPSVNIIVDNTTIEQEVLSAISITIEANDQDGQVISISSEVDNTIFEGALFTFTPVRYGVYIITTTVTDNLNAQTSTSLEIEVVEKSSSGGNCNGVPVYSPYPTIYQSGDIVSYEGKLYESVVNNLYNVIPGTADHWWAPKGDCTSSNARVIGEVNLLDEISIYPNPMSHTLNISLPGFEKNKIKIFNNNGQQIMEEYIISSKIKIDVSSLQRGIYYLSVENAAGDKVWKKVIK